MKQINVAKIEKKFENSAADTKNVDIASIIFINLEFTSLKIKLTDCTFIHTRHRKSLLTTPYHSGAISNRLTTSDPDFHPSERHNRRLR